MVGWQCAEQAYIVANFLLQGEDGTMLKLKVDKLLARRKLKKDYEYEVQWQGKGPEASTWLTRDDLVEMGLEKMVMDLDMKEAARAVSVVGHLHLPL